MKAKRNFYLIAIILFPILSCKKDKTSYPKTATQVDVYIAGYVKAQNGYYVAAYWKNGVITKLTDSTSNAFGDNIVVHGADVYVTGTIDNKGATYWKNGQPVTLSPFGKTVAIAISGNDVYVAGVSNGLCYWKNGSIVNLPGSLLLSEVNSIAVKGNDVYIVGSSYVNGSVATYWKNGMPKKLVDSTLLSYARGITIQGNDVYISGYTTLKKEGFIVAAYWKNEVLHSLSDTHFSEAIAIAVSGADVYLAGNTAAPTNGSDITIGGSYIATYWKNGAETKLGSAGRGNYASTIKVIGADVYLSGFGVDNKVFWKNNTPIQFTNDYTAVGNGMEVIPR